MMMLMLSGSPCNVIKLGCPAAKAFLYPGAAKEVVMLVI
jgi:hypothetical protein